MVMAHRSHPWIRRARSPTRSLRFRARRWPLTTASSPSSCETDASFSQIANDVGLSAHAVDQRVLKARGTIQGYTARIDQGPLGPGLAAYIDVRLLPTGDRIRSSASRSGGRRRRGSPSSQGDSTQLLRHRRPTPCYPRCGDPPRRLAPQRLPSLAALLAPPRVGRRMVTSWLGGGRTGPWLQSTAQPSVACVSLGRPQSRRMPRWPMCRASRRGR
jgi:hypothetical protein